LDASSTRKPRNKYHKEPPLIVRDTLHWDGALQTKAIIIGYWEMKGGKVPHVYVELVPNSETLYQVRSDMVNGVPQ
jgi:hypothetical protein